MNDETKLYKTALSCIGTVVLIIYNVIASGWVLSVIWAWFLVPLGMPAVTTVQAIGISVVASALMPKPIRQKDVNMTGAVVTALLSPVMTMAIAYIVKLFM
jgi:hypothetical protein